MFLAPFSAFKQVETFHKFNLLMITDLMMTLSLQFKIQVEILRLNLNLNLSLSQNSQFLSPSLSPSLTPRPPPSVLGLRSGGGIKGLSPLELMERHTCAFTHTGMRDRSCNLRWGHLEIWDGGINSIERKKTMLLRGLQSMVKKACVKMKCYSAVFNKSMCTSMPLEKLVQREVMCRGQVL